jgi:hypothetical protein
MIYNSQNLYGTIYKIFSNIFSEPTNDIENAKLNTGISVLVMRFDLISMGHPDLFLYLEIYSYRKSKGLPTKLIIDWSLEGSCDYNENDISTLFNQYGININKDVLFIHNDMINRVPIPSKIGQNISVDHHALEAYERCIRIPINSIDNTLVKDRKNGLNLLIGKLKAKHARFLTAYYFYKYDLLDDAVLGLHAQPIDILQRMKKYPEYDDINFLKKIIPLLGPADSVVKLHDTDEGCTADNGGWPFDPAIFKNSSISYICETYDVDKGNHPHLVTEKFYRSIINKHPFVIQACSGQLNTVKSLGYETFSSIIDESYNEYEALDYSHVEKTVLAAKDFLSKLPNNIDRIQEIVDYNYNHWLSRTKSEYDGTTDFFISFINHI